jgi:urease accessory protein
MGEIGMPPGRTANPVTSVAVPTPGEPAGGNPIPGPALWTLATWFSPSYPVGAFAYSHGLEWAVSAGKVRDAASAEAWIGDCILHGAGRTDAILLAHAWRAERAGGEATLDELSELAAALAPSVERRVESEAQGAAFALVTSDILGSDLPARPYPVAIGQAAGRHDLPLRDTTLLYLHAFAANLVSSCVRLVPLGQNEGQRVTASLMTLCDRLTREALSAGLDEIGGCAFRSDIASMGHETQLVRLFRT